MNKPIDPSLENLNDDFILNRADDVAPINTNEYSETPTESTGFTVSDSGEHAIIPGQTDDIFNDIEHHHHHHHSSDDSSHGKHHKHHKHHRHHHKKKKPLWYRIIIAILIIILILAIVAAATFGILSKKGQSDLKTVQTTTNEQYEESVKYKGHTYVYNSNIVTFAFLGVDKRSLGKEDDHTNTVGMADTDIVVAVDTSTGKASMISIPRDTMVDVDVYVDGIFKKTDNMELCIAYAYGDGFGLSCENVTRSISRILFNVPIDKYFALDLNGIAPINDSIGGVDVTSLYDFKNLGIRAGEKVHLEGNLTEAYVRMRDMDNIEASLNRTKRQVQYLNAFADKVKSGVKSDFGMISNLYNTASEYSTTNISLSNVTYLGSLMLSKNITNFDTYSLEGEMKAVKPAEEYADYVFAGFYPDEDNLMQTVLSVFYTQIN